MNGSAEEKRSQVATMSTMGAATLLLKDTEQQCRAFEAILGCVRTWVAFSNTMFKSRRFGLGDMQVARSKLTDTQNAPN